MTSADDAIRCERCGESWADEQCSSSDCFCTLCPYCGKQWAEMSEPCGHLVALFSEGRNQLEWLDQLPAFPRALTEAEVVMLFGNDASLAASIWDDGFEDEPEMGPAERALLQEYPGVHFIQGYFEAGWIGDADWEVVYVPDPDGWRTFRTTTFDRLSDVVERFES